MTRKKVILDYAHVMGLKVEGLKKLCAKYKLSKNGRKADLQDRVLTHLKLGRTNYAPETDDQRLKEPELELPISLAKGTHKEPMPSSDDIPEEKQSSKADQKPEGDVPLTLEHSDQVVGVLAADELSWNRKRTTDQAGISDDVKSSKKPKIQSTSPKGFKNRVLAHLSLGTTNEAPETDDQTLKEPDVELPIALEKPTQKKPMPSSDDIPEEKQTPKADQKPESDVPLKLEQSDQVVGVPAADELSSTRRRTTDQAGDVKSSKKLKIQSASPRGSQVASTSIHLPLISESDRVIVATTVPCDKAPQSKIPTDARTPSEIIGKTKEDIEQYLKSLKAGELVRLCTLLCHEDRELLCALRNEGVNQEVR